MADTRPAMTEKVSFPEGRAAKGKGIRGQAQRHGSLPGPADRQGGQPWSENLPEQIPQCPYEHPRADPDQVESAREALLRIDLLRAERLLREERTADAVAIMSRILRETGDPELAVAVARRLDQLRTARAGG